MHVVTEYEHNTIMKHPSDPAYPSEIGRYVD